MGAQRLGRLHAPERPADRHAPATAGARPAPASCHRSGCGCMLPVLLAAIGVGHARHAARSASALLQGRPGRPAEHPGRGHRRARCAGPRDSAPSSSPSQRSRRTASGDHEPADRPDPPAPTPRRPRSPRRSAREVRVAAPDLAPLTDAVRQRLVGLLRRPGSWPGRAPTAAREVTALLRRQCLTALIALADALARRTWTTSGLIELARSVATGRRELDRLAASSSTWCRRGAGTAVSCAAERPAHARRSGSAANGPRSRPSATLGPGGESYYHRPLVDRPRPRPPTSGRCILDDRGEPTPALASIRRSWVDRAGPPPGRAVDAGAGRWPRNCDHEAGGARGRRPANAA